MSERDGSPGLRRSRGRRASGASARARRPRRRRAGRGCARARRRPEDRGVLLLGIGARDERAVDLQLVAAKGALAAREREVVSLVADGMAPKAIAAPLGLPVDARGTHLSNI